ncbi:MAG: acyltransferase [Verrucomicrobia bacterium]|nr:acyltransferase [Verrucomicrobiota bacterium]
MEVRKSEVPVLDLLRGVMPVMVMMSHAALWTGCGKQLHGVFIAGGLAVDVFIFISGFLMLWHYLDREKKERWEEMATWRRFWQRRFFRMAPLYWLVLSTVLLAHQPFSAWVEEYHRLYPPPWMDRLPEVSMVDPSMGVGNALSHFTFLFGLIPKWASNNPLPDWSIGLEMQFYLAFPFLALAIRKWGWVATVLLLTVIWRVSLDRIQVGLLAPAGPWGWFPMPTFLPLRIGVFLTGMLAAGACFNPRNGRRFLWFMITSVAVAIWHNKWLAFPVAAFFGWEWLSGRPVLSGVWCMLVKKVSILLRSRPVGFIADCSYGVYLWHVPVQLCVIRVLLDAGVFAGRSSLERFALLTGATLPLVYAITWVTFRLVEKPGIALGKRLLCSSAPLVASGSAKANT